MKYNRITLLVICFTYFFTKVTAKKDKNNLDSNWSILVICVVLILLGGCCTFFVRRRRKFVLQKRIGFRQPQIVTISTLPENNCNTSISTYPYVTGFRETTQSPPSYASVIKKEIA